MYALEFRAASRNHIWIRCAICETKAPLERVRQGQPDMTRWRILRIPGTVQTACAKWNSFYCRFCKSNISSSCF